MDELRESYMEKFEERIEQFWGYFDRLVKPDLQRKVTNRKEFGIVLRHGLGKDTSLRYLLQVSPEVEETLWNSPKAKTMIKQNSGSKGLSEQEITNLESENSEV